MVSRAAAILGASRLSVNADAFVEHLLLSASPELRGLGTKKN